MIAERLCRGVLAAVAGLQVALVGAAGADLDRLTGQPADIASSAYLYRADRAPQNNPPEAWILLMQHAGQPFDQPVDVEAPCVKQALCGLFWEEIRPLRRLELTWPANAGNKP